MIMKKQLCPVCGKRHNKKSIAERCYNEVQSRYGHYVVMCGKPTIKKIEKHGLDIGYYKKIVALKEKMEKYMNTFK